MNKFISGIINEKFDSENLPIKEKGKFNWREWANKPKQSEETEQIINMGTPAYSGDDIFTKEQQSEPTEPTEQMKLTNMVHNGASEGKMVDDSPEVEVDEIVDADGNIKTSDRPGNANGYIRSKKTSDQVAKAAMGQMGSFGVLGGATGANKTLKYWSESDQSQALGNEIKNDSDMDLEDAAEYFEDELEVPKDEAKERAKKLGFDENLPDGKIRLIENPLKYIDEYLAKKGKNGELVNKSVKTQLKKSVNPIIKKQLGTIRQTLKDNGLTINDITEYLEDNE